MGEERMDLELGGGLTNTASGRATYFPDGLAPSNDRHVRDSGQTLAAPYHTPSANRSKADLDNVSLTNDDERLSKTNGKKEVLMSPSSSTIVSEPEGEQPANQKASRHNTPLDRSQSYFSRVSRNRSNHNTTDNPDADEEKGNQEDEEDRDPNLIEWDGPDDPENPHNFPHWRKWLITITLGIMTFCITFASSVFSTATSSTSVEFNVSTEVMTLGTSLFVLGFAVGPPIWGPLSELYGRKYPLFFGFFVFAIFQIPVAVAQNLQTIMVCRFFGGVFGSAPLGIVGGQLTDFWGTLDRGVATVIFAGATFIGPVAGPIVGGFVVQSHLGWRWTEYITAIMGFSFGAAGFFLVPETYAPVLLSQRAAKIRFETKNWAIHSQGDEEKVDLKTIVEKYLLRPFDMLLKEPILLLITLYMSLIYGILYLFFEAYPIAFQETRGWNPGVGALPFISISIGVVLGGCIIVLSTKTRFKRKLEQAGQVVPEERLIPMMIGGFLFPAGLFWFAWTSSPNITWVPQVLAGIPIGAGVLMIFLQGLNYIIDVYLIHANSAIAANTFLRSGFGAGFPLFAVAMYHTLGVNWATTLIAFLNVLLFPVPFLFYFYGEKIRHMSKYAPT